MSHKRQTRRDGLQRLAGYLNAELLASRGCYCSRNFLWRGQSSVLRRVRVELWVCVWLGTCVVLLVPSNSSTILEFTMMMLGYTSSCRHLIFWSLLLPVPRAHSEPVSENWAWPNSWLKFFYSWNWGKNWTFFKLCKIAVSTIYISSVYFVSFLRQYKQQLHFQDEIVFVFNVPFNYVHPSQNCEFMNNWAKKVQGFDLRAIENANFTSIPDKPQNQTFAKVNDLLYKDLE